MRKQYYAALYAVLAAAALWGSVSIFLRGLLDLGFTRYQVIVLRSVLSALLLLAFAFASGKKVPAIQKGDLRYFLGIGILNQLLFCVSYYTAISLVGVSIASILMFTSPVFSVILSALLFRERFGSRTMIALVLALTGCVFVSGLDRAAETPLVGILLGLLSGFAYSLYGIFSKVILQRGYPSFAIALYTPAFCAIGAVPLGMSQPLPHLTAAQLLMAFGMLMGMAVICGILPMFLYSYGLRSIAPGRASMLTSAEPIVATMIGVLLFHETLSWLAIAGIALIIFAVCLLAKEEPEDK